MKRLTGALCFFFLLVGCEPETSVQPDTGVPFFTLMSGITDNSLGTNQWMLASDKEGNWIDMAEVNCCSDPRLKGDLGDASTFNLHLITAAYPGYRVETWLDVPVDSEWILNQYQGSHITYPETLPATAEVPEFKGSIMNSRRSWKISVATGDVTTLWGFDQATLRAEFRFPIDDSDVIYSDLIGDQCVYQRATGFQASDSITFSNLTPMDKVIVLDYPNNSYFNCGFYGLRNRDDLNIGLRGFILSERFSETGQVPVLKMGYVNGFSHYRTSIDVVIGKRSISYVKRGGMIDAAPQFTNLEFTYANKSISNFDGTPNIGFDVFEAEWFKLGVATWKVHGPGNGNPQQIAFALKPFPKEFADAHPELDMSLLRLRQWTLTQYSDEFVYSDIFPKGPYQYYESQKTYTEVFTHKLIE